MSSTALFGNSNARGTSKNLIEFKAGKMMMKGKMVYPDNRKGQLYVYQSDDSLMHFCWKDRATGIVEDDLIIFPDDCEFIQVSQCTTGRVYLLRFKSSSRKFFFWLQDLKTDKDEEYCKRINELLNNPPVPGSQRSGGANPEGDIQNLLNNMSQQQLMQLFGGVGQIGGLGSLLGTMNRPFSGSRNTTSSLSSSATAVRPTSSLNNLPLTSDTSKAIGDNKGSEPMPVPETSNTINNDNTRIRLSDLQDFLSGIPTPVSTETVTQRNIAGELSMAIPAAISNDENLEILLSKYLPAGDSLSTTLSSPQFSQALSMFWSALQSGQAAPVIRQFNLSQEVVNAATSGNIQDFISALESETSNELDSFELTDSLCGQNIESTQQIQNQKQQEQLMKNQRELEKNDDDDDDEGMTLD